MRQGTRHLGSVHMLCARDTPVCIPKKRDTPVCFPMLVHFYYANQITVCYSIMPNQQNQYVLNTVWCTMQKRGTVYYDEFVDSVIVCIGSESLLLLV